MSLIERIIHMLLFEIGAVVVSTAAVLLAGHDSADTAMAMNVNFTDCHVVEFCL